MAAALEMNKTVEEISVGNVIVGSTVKLKSSGELCAVHRYYNSDPSRPCITLPNGSTQDDVKPSKYEWESQVPAFCAGLAASPSLLSVSDSMWCNGRLLQPCGGAGGCNFLHEMFAQLAVTFFGLGLIVSLFGFDGHAAAARAFCLFYTPFD